jgi:hypothetical protein
MPVTPRYGAIELPLPEPTTDTEAVTDPALDTILAFCQAVLNTNGMAGWAALAGDDKLPVKSVHAHDPEENALNSKHFPALYLFRSSAAEPAAWIADDYRVTTDELTLIWVFPWAPQGVQKRRTAYVNGLLKLLDAGFAEQRDPAWIATGDTDPDATRLGSHLLTRAGLWSLTPGRWQRAPVAVNVEGATGKERIAYWAVRLPLVVQERLVRATGGPLKGNVKVQTTDDPAFVKAELFDEIT